MKKKTLKDTVTAAIDQTRAVATRLATEGPEAFRPEWQNVSASLAGAVDAIAAAEDDEGNVVSINIVPLTGQLTALMEGSAKLQQELAAARASLNDFRAKVDAGELLPKARVDELVNLGRDQAITEERQRTASLNTRRQQIQEAGLPAAPDEVLNTPDDQFATCLAQAKQGLEAATKMGITLAKAPATLAGIVWSPTPEGMTASLNAAKELLAPHQPGSYTPANSMAAPRPKARIL